MLNISIPRPCHEDWNAMTPTEKGAFCAVCTKEVMDFSNMSDDEVKNYFLLNAGKKTCGRFRKEQLKGLNIVVDEQVIYTNIALWKKFLAVVVICFGALFTSCMNVKGKTDPDKRTGITASPGKTDTFPEKRYMLGGIGGMEDDAKEPPLPDASNSKIVTVNTTCYVTGDIAPPPAIEPTNPPVEAIEAIPEPRPVDTLKKLVDTCKNPKFL